MKKTVNNSPASGPLDDFWMTPVMGLRPRFDFTKSVIEMTQAAEKKRRAAEETAAQKAIEEKKPETSSTAQNVKPEIPLPPVPPPLRLLRY